MWEIWGNLLLPKGFEKLLKIAQPGHTGSGTNSG